MEIKQLKTFVVVAKTLSFSQTAQILNFAQSSISDQIKLLENELECKLFERLGRKIYLTNEGEELLIYAEKILSLCEEAKQSVIGTDKIKGSLNIATAESLCAFRLPKLLKKYGASYPEVEMRLKVGTCEDFPYMLRKNQVDVAFILAAKVEYSDIVSKTLKQESLVLVCSNVELLGKKDVVDLSELHSKNLILTQKGCSYRAMLEEYLSSIKVKPNSILALESIEAIKQYVINGFGISFLPRIAVERELESGELVEIRYSGPKFYAYAQVLYHKDKWLSQPLKAMLQMTEL